MDKKKQDIIIQGHQVRLLERGGEDYICITDIAKTASNGNARDVIRSYFKNRANINFLGLWEQMNNQNFNVSNFGHIRNELPNNNFYISVKEWVAQTDAVGLHSVPGRYGGTYAHADIALQFATWFDASTYLYLIKDYQRLKSLEQKTWTVSRILSKINYEIHSRAVQDNMMPRLLSKKEQGIAYASEADLLNVALFGMTAKEYKQAYPDRKGNMRDYATTSQLIVLSNLQSLNASLIQDGLDQDERLAKLNEVAIFQMQVLIESEKVKRLE